MKRIPLSKTGKYAGMYEAIVDDSDYECLMQYTWQVHFGKKTVYARTRIKDKGLHYMHRLIMDVTNPKIGMDHENGNGLDNRKENLRIATPSQNMANRKTRSRTKYKGVNLREVKSGFRYYAYICKDKKMQHIGTFLNDVEAARAYDKKAKELHGEFAKLNFPK